MRPFVSVQRRSSDPLHQLCRGGLSSLADVTHPASVIETDANPAPLQSPAVGWAGMGRDIERHRKLYVRDEGVHGDEALADVLKRGLSGCLETGRTTCSSSSAHLLEHLRGRDPPKWTLPPLTQASTWRPNATLRASWRGNAAGAA